MSALAVVVPAFNEGESLREFHARLAAVLDKLDLSSEVLYVDDGSRDDTWTVMCALRESDPRVATLKLSRNFGKELALTAGLDHVDADAVIVIDADLQDPPELIPEFVRGWREGYDVVYGTRSTRAGESRLKKLTAGAFYRVMERLSATPVPRDTGDFRLLSRRALDAMKRLRERQRFMKGLFAWVGFPWKAVPYDRDARHSGTTKWNYWKLAELAVEAVTSFSLFPLKVATVAGVVTALLAAGYSIFILLYTLVFGIEAPGYPSLMIAVLILGSVQLITLGVIGEYLGRVLNEAKRRPLYFVERVVKGASLSAEGASPEVHLAPPPAGPHVSGDTS